MRHSVFLALGQFGWFWPVRNSLRRLTFRVHRQRFIVKHRLSQESSTLTTFRSLLGIVQYQLFFAVACGILLQVLDPQLEYIYERLGISVLDDDAYVTLLATVSGIGGVFIGLYFTAISAVGGAIYARVPNNIRDLLSRERVGTVYMRFLAFLTFLSVCLITQRLLGFPRVVLAVPVVCILGGLGIVAFVKLGQRAFNFFDPTALASQLFHEFFQWLEAAKAGGFRWKDPSFQAHAHKQASAALDTLDTIVGITEKEPHLSGQPFVQLIKETVNMLLVYLPAKQEIPSDSHWYEIRYVHKAWHQAPETAVGMATQTATSLLPDMSHDLFWVEKRVARVIFSCITINLDSGKYPPAYQALKYFDGFLMALARQGEVKMAFDFLSDLTSQVLNAAASPSERAVLSGEELERLGFLEQLAFLPVSIYLSFMETVSDMPRNNLSKRLKNVRWTNRRAIYRQGFEAFLLPRLEWLQPRVLFEIDSYQREISPIWYKTEMLSQEAAEKLAETIRSLVFQVPKAYRAWLEIVEEAKRPWLVAAFLSREWEYWNKVTYQMPILTKAWSDLRDNRLVDGLPWPDLEIDDFPALIRKRQQELVSRMARYAMLLLPSGRPKEFPDYAGQFLDATGNSILDALCDGELGIVKGLFRPYLLGCFGLFDLNRPTAVSDDHRTASALKVAVAPIMDVMELSGYIRLLADYHGDGEFWSAIVKDWDDFLAEDDQAQRAPFLAAVVELTESALEIPYRSMLRAQWKQRVEHLLSQLPRKHRSTRRMINPVSEADHPSPLLRLFTRGTMRRSFYDGIDVFIASYLQKLPEAAEFNFGQKRRHLFDELQRENLESQEDSNPDERVSE